MMRRNLLFRALLVLVPLCAGMLFAQNPPVEDINAQRNPELAAAQQHCRQAFEYITNAQKANKFDMKGHAQRAKALVAEASRELSAAAKLADSPAAGKTAGSRGLSKKPASGSAGKLPQ